MDPTENLKEQLAIARGILSGYFVSGDLETDADRLAELVYALDTWICKGGFLPKQWEGKR